MGDGHSLRFILLQVITHETLTIYNLKLKEFLSHSALAAVDFLGPPHFRVWVSKLQQVLLLGLVKCEGFPSPTNLCLQISESITRP